MKFPPNFKVYWVNAEREPQCAPDPAYPEGIDIDLSEGTEPTCMSDLPYPAPRCGAFVVECKTCGRNALISTAGRPDDPRSIKFRCDRPQ